jgi:hypothetical protein
MAQPKLNLEQLVTMIRDELERVDSAQQKAKRGALFRLSGLEVELSVVVEENTSAKGGFDIKVLSLGAETGVRTEQIQKILLKYDVPSDFKGLGALAR